MHILIPTYTKSICVYTHYYNHTNTYTVYIFVYLYILIHDTPIYVCSWYDHVTGHRHAALALAHDLKRRLLPILHAWYRHTSEERRNRSAVCVIVYILLCVCTA